MPESLEDQYVVLIQQHEGIIHKVIGLHVDAVEDKRDLFQEILLQAWKSFEKFQGNAAFSTWLYRVALNTVFNFKKSEKKNKKASAAAAELAATPKEKKEDHELLYDLIRQLNEVDRTLMTLHLDGYKNKEIADILGMTANHVNVKIHRLKTQIVESFKNVKNGSV
ncbi:MAG: sigma-70 family RNA polymerase sigma factor [Bacteroidota bacterium]